MHKLTSGRQCCLWCLIKQTQLKAPPSVRGPVQLRTIQSICADHKRFTDNGSVVVKEYNNCQYEPFFTNFPLTQVYTVDIQQLGKSPITINSYRSPGLHISLGIFLRLFVLLEADCHMLDMTMSIQGGSGGPSFDRYSSALQDKMKLQDEQKELKASLLVLQQLLTYTLTTGGMTSTTNPLLLEVVSEIQKTKAKLQHIVG